MANMYKWKGEHPDKSEKQKEDLDLALFIKRNMNKDEFEKLEKEFGEYRDTKHKNEEELFPFYIWLIKRNKNIVIE